jgi:hemerythrin-like metal-binding protein
LLHVDVSSRTAPPAPRLPEPVRRAFARSRNEILDRAGDLLVDAWLKTESLAVLAVGLNAPEAGWTAQRRAALAAQLMEALRPCLRDGDVIGNNGDDGLLIAIPNLSGASSAGIVAGRLIEAAKAASAGAEGEGHGWNIGIALFPDDDQELSGLLTHAGAALEFARQCGPNRYSLAETSLNLCMNPAPMPWNPQLKAGMAELDAQHSHVLDELRALLHVIGTGSDPAVLQDGMDAIRAALMADFRAEDALMLEHPGPAADAHRKDHARVLRNMGLLAHADTRQSLALAARFVHQWLMQHIREFDAPLVVSTYRPLW